MEPSAMVVWTISSVAMCISPPSGSGLEQVVGPSYAGPLNIRSQLRQIPSGDRLQARPQRGGVAQARLGTRSIAEGDRGLGQVRERPAAHALQATAAAAALCGLLEERARAP